MPGTTDGPPPERYTAYDLSRIKDALDALKRLNDHDRNSNFHKALWKSLPNGLKVEYNHSKWEYVP
jgi:hypothetical protein